MSVEKIANHSELGKFNIQFFAEEDAILPDDFEEQPVDTTDTEQVPTEEQPTEETATEEQPIEEAPQTIKVKFNHEEQDLPLDEAIPLVQKGMNYDKVQERLNQLESDPRLTFVEELANQNGMTTEQFIEVFKQQQEQDKLNDLVQQNIPEELAQEIIENQKFRQQYESEKKAKAQEEKTNQDYLDFFKYYKEANGKDFDAEKDKIPDEVWQEAQQGTPLKFAYMQHENSKLRQSLQVQKKNEENQKKAPVNGVTEHGSTSIESTDPFLEGFNSD